MRVSLPRWRSLRVRAYLVVAIVVLTPLALVWGADLADQNAGSLMRQSVQETLEQASEQVAADTTDAEAIEVIARKRSAWIRVLEPDERRGWSVSSSHDQEAGLRDDLEAYFFPPEQVPTLRSWDAGQPDLAVRPEVIVAEQQDQGSRCTLSSREDLLVCAAAMRVTDETGQERVVHVQQSSRRAIRTLHDQRYQMVKLTLVVAVVGVFLGTWLGWRFVRPIEQLRQQIADRRNRRSAAPVTLQRDDELGDLARSFNGLLQALEERTAANEAFAADLAHELKNPLAAIRAAAEALDRNAPLSPERARRLARILSGSSGRLDVLVTQFLQLARAEAGLPTSEREPIRLDELVKNVVSGMTGGVEDLRVELDLTPRVRVHAAPERLETVVRNLVDNALQHAGQGEGSPVVHVLLDVVDSEARLRICDSGPGVPEADRDLVFQRFFSRRAGGTGLGLALSRAITEAHSGRLTVEDGVLAGACFVMRLPLYRK